MTTATFSTIQVGSRVCRRSVRDHKIVGTVVSVGNSTARVQWDVSLMGLVRISNGRSQSSRIRLSALVPESEWQRRVIGKPARDDYRPTLVRVDLADGSGLCIYGTNAWQFHGDESEKALEMGKRFAAEGKHAKVSRREEAKVMPAGCRVARTFSRWVTLFQS